MPHERKIARLVPKLLRWFSKSARDLPWRRTQDPYAIWISEIMLQQTQVKTVIPYWRRWMRELPTLQALARAKSERVLKLWEGLGYYTRARNLQKAAQQIVIRHQEEFPQEFEDILALPGVGRYTAGAIGSIAFNQATPILDGNIVRVLTRLFNISQDPRRKNTNRKLWDLAARLVQQAASLPRPMPPGRRKGRSAGPCSSLNQALMELGAVVCTPRQPQCPRCPVQRHCAAYQKGRVAQLPYRPPPQRAVARRFAAVVVQHQNRFWVRRRPAGLVNADLWEFPNRELVGPSDGRIDVAHLVPGASPASLKPFCTVTHSITRFRIRLEVYRLAVRDRPTATEGRWLRQAELEPLAFPSAHRKVLQKLIRARQAKEGLNDAAEKAD
jgi:A/G-specific adenine glycosylase